MRNSKKFDSTRFRELMDNKIRSKGYKNVSQFVVKNGFNRNALARGMAGITRPSPESIDRWCDVLECSPIEKKEIYHSVGHLTQDEIDEAIARNPAA
jgi:hypothetical protein